MSKIKILVITAHYPPYHFGGYEIRSKNIVDELSRRGHDLLVITSRKAKNLKRDQIPQNYGVLRRLIVRARPRNVIDQLTHWRFTHLLGMLLTFIREIFCDLQDMKFLEGQIRQFQPDLIYLGHITVFSRALMPFLAGCALPIVYDEGGSGLIDSWTERGIWYTFVEEFSNNYSILKNLKSLTVKFVCQVSKNRIRSHWDWPPNMQVIFNSQLNCTNAVACGVPVGNSHVIHSGIDTQKFTFKPRTKFGSPLTLIVPGRIEPRKGQLDAVMLLAELREQGLDSKLIFVGQKWANSYYSELEEEIKKQNLEKSVEFFSMMTQDELVGMYYQADICFFPSYQQVGYSRTPLEAMACGCILFSYGNEGSDEIISDTRTGFLVSPAEFRAIANIIKELTSNPITVRKITESAGKVIEVNCSMVSYIDSIEKILISRVGSP